MLFYSENYLQRNTLNHFIPEPGMAESLFSLYALITNGLLIGFWVLIAWCLYTFARSKNRWLALIGILLICTIAGLFGYNKYTKYRAKKDYQEAKAAAEAHFSEVCKKTGIFVYKTIPPQDTVLIMKPVSRPPTPEQLQDQYWMGDPYGHSYGGIEYYPGLLLGTSSRKFRFIESKVSDSEKHIKISLTPVYGKTSRSQTEEILRYKVDTQEIPVITSNVGITWDDISTKEDRNHWIACGRRQIIDLKTNEVVAERIGCKFDSWLGLQPYGTRKPWADSRGGDCPKGGLTEDDWLRAVLRPQQNNTEKEDTQE